MNDNIFNSSEDNTIYKIDSYLGALPGSDALYVRDKKKLAHSNDFVFLCTVLQNWHSETKSLSLFKNSDENYIALLKDSSGLHYHPVTGESYAADDLKLQNEINKRTLKGYVKKGFYGFRSSIIKRSYKTVTILADELKIFNEGVPDEENIKLLNSKLRWPMDGDHDITDEFENHLQLEDKSFSDNSASFYAYCPVDGYVNAINGYHISPEWTWSSLCGRKYRLLLCPHCLGKFTSYLTSMS